MHQPSPSPWSTCALRAATASSIDSSSGMGADTSLPSRAAAVRRTTPGQGRAKVESLRSDGRATVVGGAMEPGRGEDTRHGAYRRRAQAARFARWVGCRRWPIWSDASLSHTPHARQRTRLGSSAGGNMSQALGAGHWWLPSWFGGEGDCGGRGKGVSGGGEGSGGVPGSGLRRGVRCGVWVWVGEPCSWCCGDSWGVS